MRGKSINHMCLAELRRELMKANEQHNVYEIRRIKESIEHFEKDIEHALETWTKSPMFKLAMDVLINEGKGKIVVREGKRVREIDVVEVLLKLSDIVKGVSKATTDDRKRHNIIHEGYERYCPELRDEDEKMPKGNEFIAQGEVRDAATVSV